MAKLPFPTLRKRRTREHIIADLAVNHVERQVLLCGFTVERIRMDYGIDLFVHTYNRRGEIENGRILFQVKATSRSKLSRDGRQVVCRLDRADLHYWAGESMPVILVHYDAHRDSARWLHIQDFLTKKPWTDWSESGNRVSLGIPWANLFDRRAMNNLARKKNAIAARAKKESDYAD